MVERMMNERSERNRWVFRAFAAVVFFLAVAILFGHRFYVTIQSPHWSSLTKAEAAAVERLNVSDVTEVHRFISDRVYNIVFATSAAGEKLVIWMWEDQVHMKRQSEGLTKEQVKELALTEDGAKELLRISPGKLNDEYVWEVMYSLQVEGGYRHYYDYYRFTDGVKLETYRLALQKER